MTLDDIKFIELEITSLCNLECGLCHRTKEMGRYELTSLTIQDIKNMFPTKQSIDNKFFLLCGALGDPVANKDCFSIVEYLISNNGWVELNSNTSLETAKWWYNLGKLSSDSGKGSIWFCVDGYKETNDIYRVNANFKTIIRNIESYVQGSKDGRQGFANATWMYNVFDHNEYELDLARGHAEKLGLKFATRKGIGNSLGFVQKKRVKDKETRVTTIDQKRLHSTQELAHSKADLLKELFRITNEQKRTS